MPGFCESCFVPKVIEGLTDSDFSGSSADPERRKEIIRVVCMLAEAGDCVNQGPKRSEAAGTDDMPLSDCQHDNVVLIDAVTEAAGFLPYLTIIDEGALHDM